MHRSSYAGALASVLVIVSCLGGGGGEAGDAEPRAAVPPPIDRGNPAITETATFALG